MDGLIFEAILIFVLVILNGFFSGSEIAVISAKRSILDKLKKEGSPSAAVVVDMKDKPDRFLATIQVGVTVVSTLASVIGGVTAIEILKPIYKTAPFPIISESAEFLSVASVTIVISYILLVVGELVPKSIALRYSERTSIIAAQPLKFISKFASPFITLMTASTNAFLRLLRIKPSSDSLFISEEEIKYYIKEGRATGVLEETEAQLLHGVFEFADTTVREVMVPKPNMHLIDIKTGSDEIIKYISDTGYSRYPVFENSTDNIKGVLFNKDVFRVMEKGQDIFAKGLIRDPFFIPDSIMISKLLREMQRRKVHMAIVVDEHGQVDGLVTIEDILEEIVGEIEDEYDVNKGEGPGSGGIVERRKDGSILIDATATLRDLEDHGFDYSTLAEEEYTTMAGFMLARLQRIPLGGEFVTFEGYRYTVVDMEDNRIVKVKAEPVEEKTNGKDSSEQEAI